MNGWSQVHAFALMRMRDNEDSRKIAKRSFFIDFIYDYGHIQT